MRWILRTWTKRSFGWESDFESFDSKKEAIEAREIYKNIYADSMYQRSYDIYCM